MSKNIVRVNKTQNYTVMSNTHLKDERLSWKAKGIHSYILSLPDDWKVIIEHLKKVSTDGERSTRSGINELYELRYWQKYPVYINGKVNQWVTEIYEEPFPESELIKSIVIRDGKKTINYENGKTDADFLENNLLCQNAQVGESLGNTSADLLCQNVQVGSVQVDNVDVGNEGLLNTNTTNNLLCTNHSLNQSKKKNERMNENIDKDILENEFQNLLFEKGINSLYYPNEYIAIERSLRTLYFRETPLTINGISISPKELKNDLNKLQQVHIDSALNIFKEQCKIQKINNRISYLAVCIYNSIFDSDLKLTNDLGLNGY